MNNETQRGYLVLADISGYTFYLAGTELTHARVVMSTHLDEHGQETRMNIYAKLKMPLPRWITRPLANFMFKQGKLEAQFDKLVRLIAQEAAQDESKG
jgi:hypothetical protein